MFCYIPQNFWQHSLECLATFPGMFRTFPGMLGDIPRNVWWHSLECLAIFSGMFEDIAWNVWLHSLKCLATFRGMLKDISRYVWQHSAEYNIPLITRVPRIPLPVPVFLVLHSRSKFDTERFFKFVLGAF